MTDARAEMDELLDASIRMAQRLLAEHGEFFPFGATVREDGSVAMAGADPGEGEHPDSVSVIELLTGAFSAQAASGSIRAAAISCDVRIRDREPDFSDAIRVTIEHRDGDPVHVLLPYRLDSNGSAEYGALTASQAPRIIFA